MNAATRRHSSVCGLLALAICSVVTTASAATNFYVDPVSGNDGNSGTSIATPFRTLDRSRQAVAAVNAGMTQDITVYLRGGIHRLTTTLTLGPADSGMNGFSVVYANYANETPVISGGADLSGGWILHDAARNIYKKTGVTFAFRQLYVNASSAIRARTPNQNNDDTSGPYLTMTGVNSANKQAIINPADISNWSGLTNVEMVMNPHWYHYRGRISSYTANATQALVTFRSPESNVIFGKGDGFWPNAPYFFENSIDFLDAEGEWFLDTAGSTLYYKPRSGENMATATVEAPLLDKLVQVSGTSSSNKVRNVRFDGLTFTESGWNGPSTNGSAMTQGARELVTSVNQGAVTAEYADELEFGSCSFRFLGLNGISYVKGVTGGSIHDSDFRWICANGLVIHDAGVANPAAGDACQNIRIVNNSISHIGRQYSNGIGIVSYFVKRMLIADNEISYGPYMGTQTGGQSSGNIEVGMKDNILRNNFVHHVMQLHDDGGAYYTLARQQGTHVLDNWADTLVRSQWAGQYAVAGLYADNYSEFLTFENNAVVNCASITQEQVTLGAQNNQWISTTTTADPAITGYAGRKADYFWPVKREAEEMAVSGGAVESGASYSNDAGVAFNAVGSISMPFSGPDGTYNINTAYVTGDSGAASYRLLVNGTQVDAWTATLTPTGTGLQIRHRITRSVNLPAGATVALEATPVSGTPARVDYVEIYGHQAALPAAPNSLAARAVSASGIALSWNGALGADSYTVYRSDSPAGPFSMVAEGISGTSWQDSGLVQGQTYFYTVSAVNASGASPSSETASASPDPSINTTSLEATADAFVQRGNPTTNFGGATEVVVKNASTTSIQRKGYIRFDLANHAPYEIPNASFQVVVSTWNQNVSWQVYGLKDGDVGETWDENSIVWNNAPANITTTGDTLDTNRVILLGTLSPSGIPPVGNVLELKSAALDAFLLADTNAKVTFVLVRTTNSDLGNSAVASREHPTLAAPSLQFQRGLLKSNWTGKASGDWSNGANWQGTVLPASDYGTELQFFNGQMVAAGAITATNNVSSPMAANRIVLAGTGTATSIVNIDGFPLKLERYGGTQPSVQMSGGPAGYRYNIGNGITLDDTTTFAATGNGTFVFNGGISGPGGITRTSSNSTLILAGNNSYSGTTTITAGTLQIGNDGASGNLGTGPVVNQGVLRFDRSGTLDVPNSISGSGSLLVSGVASADLVSLSGNNSYSGTTTVSSGTLQIGNGGTSGNLGPGAVINNGILRFDRAGSLDIPNDLSGTGGLIINAAASSIVTISGVNSMTGPVTINGGSLRVTDPAQLGNGAKNITVNGAAAALRLDGSAGPVVLPSTMSLFTTNLNGAIIHEAGNSEIDGNITLTVGAGNTRIISNSGTLTITGNISPNTTSRILDLRGAGNGVIFGTIKDGSVTNTLAGVTKSDGGTWTLNGANLFTGSTSVSAGGLVVNGSHTCGSVSVSAAGTLGGSGSINAPASISGTLAPGNGVGTMNFGDTLSFDATASLQWELATNSLAADQVIASNSVSITNGASIGVVLNGAGSTVNFLNSFWRSVRTFPIVTGSSRTGTFSLAAVTADSRGRPVSTYGGFSVQHTATGAVLVWTPIPGFPVIDDPALTITRPATLPIAIADATHRLRVSATAVNGTISGFHWSMVSGPGTATFADPNAADTTVTFSDQGSYLLRCTAENEAGSGSSDLAVAVVPSPFTITLREDGSGYSAPATFIRADTSSWNSGASSQISMGRIGTRPMRALLSFPMPPILNDKVIASASLTMTIAATGSGAILDTLELHRLLTNFDEGTGDGSSATNGAGTGADWLRRTNTPSALWSYAGGLAGTDYDSATLGTSPGFNPAATSPGSAVTFGSSPAFVAAVADAITTAQPLGLFALMNNDVAGSARYANFASEDHPTVNWRPALSIGYYANLAPVIDTGLANAAAVGVPLAVTGSVSNGTGAGWTLVKGPGQVFLSDASALGVTAVFSVPGTYQLALTATNAFGETSRILTVNATGTAMTELEKWRQTHFGTEADSGNSANNFDSNGDGETNLYEFATAQDPSAGTLVSPTMIQNGANLEFTYTRSKAAISDGFIFTVEWSEDLTSGTWSTSGISNENPAPISQDAATETLRIAIPAGSGKRFVRLRVSSP